MEGVILVLWRQGLSEGIDFLHRLMETGPPYKTFFEEPLFYAGLAKAFGSIDGIAPKDADHVIGLEGRVNIRGISFACCHGIGGRFPTANVLFAILEADREVADQDGLLGESVNFVELFLGELAMKRGLDRDAVHIG